jgi:hypothetical protein
MMVMVLTSYSLLTLANDIGTGTRVVNSTISTHSISSIKSAKIISEDEFSVKVEATVEIEGNICGAKELVSQMTNLNNSTDDWDAHIMNNSFELNLIGIGSNEQVFAACLMYSKPTQVNVIINLYTNVGAVGKDVFQTANYRFSNRSKSHALVMTEEYGKGWSFVIEKLK